MLDTRDFDAMVEELGHFDELREQLIKKSRDVLKLSKQVIYAVHRSDMKSAASLVKEIQKAYGEMHALAIKNSLLESVGAYTVSVQEYVEALSYYHYVSDKSIPTSHELKVDSWSYLLGLCDLGGELVRKAINDAIAGNTESALSIKKDVEKIYGQLIRFDFRDSKLRKSFDRIRYDLRRLEDVALDIKLKNP
jgi:translin